MRKFAPGVALAIALGYVYRHLFQGELLAGRDVLRLAYPDATFLRQCLLRLEWPLWIPNVFLGQPFAATLQSQAFYPPRVLFVLAFGAYWGVSLLQVFHAAVAAIGAWRFARALGRSRWAAVVAGAAFGLSPLFTELSGTFNLVSAAAWTGWIVAEALPRGRSWRLAAFVALAALAGAPELVLGQLVIFGAVWLGARRPGAWRRLAGWAWAGALAAIALLPTFEFARGAARGEHGSNLDWSASWRSLAALFWPLADQPRGSYWSDQWLLLELFIGSAVVALAVVAVARRRPRRVVIALGVAAVGLALLSLGRHFPPAAWLLELPGLRSFRYPAKALVVVSFCVAMLAAFGIDRVAALQRRTRYRAFWLVAPVAAGLVLSIAGLVGLNGRVPALALVGWLWLCLALPLLFAACRSRWRSAPAVVALLELAVFHLHVGTSLVKAEELARPSRLAVAGEGRYSVDPSAGHPDAPVREQDDTAQKIEVTRGLDEAAAATRDALLPNRFVEDGIFALEGYGAPEPPRIHRFQFAKKRAIYDLAGVTRFVSPAFEDLVVDGPLWRSSTAMPQAFVVHAARVVSDDEALAAIDAGEARTTALLAEGSAVPSADRCEGSAARIVARTANSVEVEVDACGAGWLVLSDAYDSGWVAEVKGAETPVHRADYALRAVAVPAGKSHVLFDYRPWSFRIGAAVSFLAWAAWAWAVVRRRRLSR